MEYETLLILIVIGVNAMGNAEGGCPTGFVTHGASCYHFSHDTESWIGAMNTCRELDSHLVEINDESENKFLELSAKLLKTVYWIALSDIREEGTWVWMNSHETLTNTSFTDWSPGQPNNANSDENCACLRNHAGTWEWFDYTCHNNIHYICEKAEAPIDVIG